MARQLGIFFGILLLIAVGFGAYQLTRKPAVPKEFSDARARGGVIAQDIVNSSNDLLTKLKTVNDLEKEKKFDEAKSLVSSLIDQNGEIRGKANELSGELNTMTNALPKIQSEEARQIALEAIASRVALGERLINYSDYLKQLLTLLEERIGNAPNPEVESLVQKINEEVKAINDFNAKAGELMDQFDKLVK